MTSITRSPYGAAAKELAAAGLAIIQAGSANQASLIDALRGAYGVFVVIQPWSYDYRKIRTELELIQGKNIIWACKNSGVKQSF